MSISRDHSKKAPSQNPVDFYKCDKSPKTPQKVGDRLSGGPMVEKIDGRKSLGK